MKKKVVKSRKRREFRRTPMGINVFGGGRAPICAYQVYEVVYSDGTVALERGRTLYTMPMSHHLQGDAPKSAYADMRCDLLEVVTAAGILLAPISAACSRLDTPKPKKPRKVRP